MSSTLNTLIEGVSEIQRGNFSTAIELLEEYCQNYKPDSEDNYSEYIYAQQHIVKAYGYLGDKSKAIKRTKELAINGHPQIKKWAKRVLAYLSPEAYQSLPQEVIESDNQPLWDSQSAKLVLHSINDYLEFGSNSHVVETLETACESLKFNTKEHLYAQVLLIEAYHLNGQSKNAVALCNQLLNSKHYVTRLVANQYLSSLSKHEYVRKKNIKKDTNLLTSREASVIYQRGYNALIDKNFAEAFDIFEEYCESASPGSREYLQASKYLVHFYQSSGELEQAISLCIKLITTEDKLSQRWARELLYGDLFRETPPENIIDDLDLSIETGNIEKSSAVIKSQSQNSVSQTALKPFRLKKLDEFKQFYLQSLLKTLKVFETRRKQAIATIIVCNITAFTTLIFIFKYPSFVSLSLIPLFLIIYLLFYHSVFKAFTDQFEDKIIKKIYEFIDTDQHLTISTEFSDKENNQTLADIRKSQFLNGLLELNDIKQSYLISGNINNIAIKLAKIDISSSSNQPWTKIFNLNRKQEVKTSVTVVSFFAAILLFTFRLLKAIPYVFNRIIHGKSLDFQRFQIEALKNESYNTQVFKKLFFTAKSHKLSHTLTVIRPKLSETEINLLYYGKKQFIKLEDADFNSLFTVYSEDLVQANKTLSPSLIEKLVRFRKKVNKNIYLSFIDDMIYIAIEYPEGIFEPNLFKSMLKFAPVRKYFEAIQFMLGIVEDLR
ncbi:MAG: DUF3137 domain-containing protein [Rivularia sp. (in: cyanobacteria)]